MAAAWRRGGGPPLVLGHRGASAHAVENTMAAFARAAADGADGIELDVRLAADGALVVFHDDDLSRLAGRPERIDRLPGRALAAVALAGGGRIPTLDEVLGELPDLLVNVEIKSPGVRRTIDAARAVAAAVRRTGAAERVLVSSFDPAAVAASRLVMPQVRRGLLFHRDQARPLRQQWAAPVVRPFAVHPERGMVDRDRLARWRRAGYAVNVWTVDGESEVRRLANLAVDALISNDPAATRGWLDRAAPAG
jgi:glycerophosphoryl diester phosphodiesterase